jgi:hypothetical protein
MTLVMSENPKAPKRATSVKEAVLTNPPPARGSDAAANSAFSGLTAAESSWLYRV